MNKKTSKQSPKIKKIKIPRTDGTSSDYTTEIIGRPQAEEKTGLDFQQIQEALDETLKKTKKKQ